MDIEDELRIESEGYSAYEAGMNIVHNPYPMHSAEYITWKNGFQNAEDECLSDDENDIGDLYDI